MHPTTPRAGTLTILAIALAALLPLGGATAQAKSFHHPVLDVGTAHKAQSVDRTMRSKRNRILRRSQHHGKVSKAVALASQTAPTARPADLLFDGSHISDFDQIQAASGAITEVADPAGSGESSFQMTVDDNDVYPVTPTDNPRAQALSPPLIEPGDEIWLQTKFMLPSDMPTVKGWMSLMQIYGPPFNGSSPWEIDVAEHEILWQRNDTYDWDIPWRMPLVKGRWISVLLHERFATDGWVEMWIDGQQVSFFGSSTRLSMQTMDPSNDGGPNSAKIMQYREAGMFASASVYFGPLKLGTTRESVGG
jgi:Polysaccharide lyase